MLKDWNQGKIFVRSKSKMKITHYEGCSVYHIIYNNIITENYAQFPAALL